MTTMAPDAVNESLDPRDPLLRLSTFFDDGTVELLHERDRSGVLAGAGTVNGVRTVAFCTDGTVMGGAMGVEGCQHIVNAYDTAIEEQSPIVGIWHSGGARLAEGVKALHAVGLVFEAMIRASGYIPQICLLFGPSAAGGAYIPAFCDIVIMNDGNASMYLGSPRMAEMVIGEKVSLEEMGGAKMHCSVSGCGDLLVKSEEEAISLCKDYLRYMPSNCDNKVAELPAIDPKAFEKNLEQVIPEKENIPFDMYQVIDRLIDEGSWFEMKKLFASEMITGFGRIGGRAVGIIANQPRVKGGVLFVDSADKAARFIWLCDSFNIPLLYLADVPGFMIGTKVERQGIIRAGAKMIAAMSEAGAQRAARYGTHLLPQGPRQQVLDPWREAVTAGGGDPSAFRVGIIRSVFVTDDKERDWPLLRTAERYRMSVYNKFMAETPDRYEWGDPGAIPQNVIIGTAEECVAELRSFIAAFGITDIATSGLPPGVDPALMAGNLERLAADVIPHLR